MYFLSHLPRLKTAWAGKALSRLPLVLPAAFFLILSPACSRPKANSGAKARQSLVIGEQFDLQSIDPIQGMLDDTQILVYNGLVEIDHEFKLSPGLAESWTMSPDGLTWTFKLRKNVRFHNGENWNAQAALANFKRLEGYPAQFKSPGGGRTG